MNDFKINKFYLKQNGAQVQKAIDYALQVPQLSEAIVEQQADIDNQQTAIADLKASIGQQHLMFAEGDTVDEQLEWLESNGDTSKVYVLKDNFFYEHKKVVVDLGGSAYENKLPLATDTDRTTIYNGVGWKGDGTRLSSSGSVSTTDVKSVGTSGFIPCTVGDVIRIKNFRAPTGAATYMIAYNSSNAKTGYQTWLAKETMEGWWSPSTTHPDWYTVGNDVVTVTLTEALFGTGFNAVRFSGAITAETIITVNQEIVEGGQTAIIETWASTGQALVPTDYDAPISELVNRTDAQAKAIDELKEWVENGMPEDVDTLSHIRNWDAPIYDTNIPVFELSTEKPAMTDATKIPSALYALYDDLMARNPQFVTKTDLGLSSDGVNHVYRYDFKNPKHRENNTRNSETKPKAIIVSGIHREWAGAWGLYYALEEITENPNLRDFRRNIHLIVVPCVNPFAMNTENSATETGQGQLNANGVEIHRNFEVAFKYPGDSGYLEPGDIHHGGTEPLSEVETQYIDAIFKENTDAAFFLTCHNYNLDSNYGIGFIWPSVATAYMCNMGYRLIDKMSEAWMDTHNEVLTAGIAANGTDKLADWDTRFGHAQLSLTNGTETRQATKYGIQGANIEICERFWAHGTADSTEPICSEFTMSRGAEVYVNFLLMSFGCYDPKDKKEYYIS